MDRAGENDGCLGVDFLMSGFGDDDRFALHGNDQQDSICWRLDLRHQLPWKAAQFRDGFADTRTKPARRLLFGPVMPLRCRRAMRSEEHTSELQSLMRISYAVFCLKQKKSHIQKIYQDTSYKKKQTNVTDTL